MIRFMAFGHELDLGDYQPSGKTRYVQWPTLEFGIVTFEQHPTDTGGMEYRLTKVAHTGHPKSEQSWGKLMEKEEPKITLELTGAEYTNLLVTLGYAAGATHERNDVFGFREALLKLIPVVARAARPSGSFVDVADHRADNGA